MCARQRSLFALVFEYFIDDDDEDYDFEEKTRTAASSRYTYNMLRIASYTHMCNNYVVVDAYRIMTIGIATRIHIYEYRIYGKMILQTKAITY